MRLAPPICDDGVKSLQARDADRKREEQQDGGWSPARDGGRDMEQKQDSDRDRQTGPGKRRGASRDRKRPGPGWGRDKKRANRDNREEGQQKLRETEGQPERVPLPPWLPQCQAGLCTLKATPETPACWSTKARKKAVKLEGSRAPDARDAYTQGGGSESRRYCPVPWPPPSYLHSTPT